MNTNRATQGVAYYTYIGAKDSEGIKQFLHPDVAFYGPLATLKGKEAVLKATQHFMEAFVSLTIRAQFGNQDQAMIVYDVDIPGIKNHFPGASLLHFQENLIIKIELFYDASCFLEQKDIIFSKN